MNPLDRMLAEHEISRLITQFALLNDAGDWAGVAHTFTVDGQFVRPAGGEPIIGREAIRASLESRPPRKSCHIISNVVVDVSSENEALARCTLLLFAAPAGAADAASPGLVGGFRDKLVRTPDGWRFAERTGFLDLKVALA